MSAFDAHYASFIPSRRHLFPCQNFVEYYDINADPWQLNNAADQLTPSQRQDLQQRLNALRKCAGVECRQL